MRNVSGYLTEDGKFFTDKKEAEAHERMANTNKRIQAFVDESYEGDPDIGFALQKWEIYRLEKDK